MRPLIIVNASRSYERKPWLEYDNHFRRTRAADSVDTGGFSRIDSSIWTLHFGGAKAKLICRECFEPGHGSCTMEEQRPVAITRQKDPPRSKAWPYNKTVAGKPNDGTCWKFNSTQGCDAERATGRRCRFRHSCEKCKEEGHPVSRCPGTRRTASPTRDGGPRR